MRQGLETQQFASTQEFDFIGVVDDGPPGTVGIEQVLHTHVGTHCTLSFDAFAGTSFTGGYKAVIDYLLNGVQLGTDLQSNRSTFTYSFVGALRLRRRRKQGLAQRRPRLTSGTGPFRVSGVGDGKAIDRRRT